jgi:hypothetical protein
VDAGKIAAIQIVQQFGIKKEHLCASLFVWPEFAF